MFVQREKGPSTAHPLHLMTGHSLGEHVSLTFQNRMSTAVAGSLSWHFSLLPPPPQQALDLIGYCQSQLELTFKSQKMLLKGIFKLLQFSAGLSITLRRTNN